MCDDQDEYSVESIQQSLAKLNAQREILLSNTGTLQTLGGKQELFSCEYAIANMRLHLFEAVDSQMEKAPSNIERFKIIQQFFAKELPASMPST